MSARSRISTIWSINLQINGLAVIIISDDLAEVVANCSRVIVMKAAGSLLLEATKSITKPSEYHSVREKYSYGSQEETPSHDA
jgi:ABC-type sugar transport system ATPase subunit